MFFWQNLIQDVPKEFNSVSRPDDSRRDEIPIRQQIKCPKKSYHRQIDRYPLLQYCKRKKNQWQKHECCQEHRTYLIGNKTSCISCNSSKSDGWIAAAVDASHTKGEAYAAVHPYTTHTSSIRNGRPNTDSIRDVAASSKRYLPTIFLHYMWKPRMLRQSCKKIMT